MNKFSMIDNSVRKEIDKTFIKGVIKLIILKNIERKNNYPYGIFKKIKSNKHFIFKISKNDLYNTISSMEKDGLIKSNNKISKDNGHKTFQITEKGKEISKKSKEIMHSHITALKKLMVDING